MIENLPDKKVRNQNRILRHYNKIEKELASCKLTNAPKEDRKKLYSLLDDDLFLRVPDHPQIERKKIEKEDLSALRQQLKLLYEFIKPQDTFLEIGSGDCRLAIEIAKYVKQVIATDVSEYITKNISPPNNFKLILSDGTSFNVKANSVNIAYSNQVIEHLHPDDAVEQLQNLYKVLAPGGLYICITPHQFNGPHDISKYFDDKATGFHINEYTNKELHQLLKLTGFRKIQTRLFLKGTYIKFPAFLAVILENLLEPLSFTLKRKLSSSIVFRNILAINLIAKKPL